MRREGKIEVKLRVGQRADEGESMGDARMLGRCRDGRRAASLDWGGGSGGERGAPRRGVLRRRPPWQRTRWRRRLSVLRKRDYYTKTIQRLSTICTKELYEDNNIHWRLRWLSLDLSGSGCWHPRSTSPSGGAIPPAPAVPAVSSARAFLFLRRPCEPLANLRRRARRASASACPSAWVARPAAPTPWPPPPRRAAAGGASCACSSRSGS